LRKEAFEREVIILPAGERSIRFRPPLNITAAEVDEGIAVLRASLAEMRTGYVPRSVEEVALPPAE
jgi:4-aminobutyrate aminotransferase-like enzyme